MADIKLIRLVTRICLVVVLVIALALVGSGAGVRLAGGAKFTDISISNWGDIGSRMGGQYYVFIFTIFVAVEVAVVTVMNHMGMLTNMKLIFYLDVANLIHCLISFAVEAYYASGAFFGDISSLIKIIDGWAAAAAFYVMAAIGFGALLFLSRR